ncbi:MAG: sulfite exporter TauE/SafE family protein [Planctomycetota bacterium]
MIDFEILATVAILFAACVTRSTFGFGEALVAMPLLSMVVGVKEAAATVALTSIFNASVILLTTRWEQIEWAAAGYMFAGALLGVPLGVYVLVNVPESAVKLVLAAVVISFAVYNLTRPALAKLNSNVPGLAFGFISGVLGGAYNAFGPPLVIFGTLRQWPAERFRITLQAVFFPISLTVAGLHSANKLWTPLVINSFLAAIPFLIVAAIIGREVNKRIEGARFARLIAYLLLVIGAVLIGTIVREAIGNGP